MKELRFKFKVPNHRRTSTWSILKETSSGIRLSKGALCRLIAREVYWLFDCQVILIKSYGSKRHQHKVTCREKYPIFDRNFEANLFFHIILLVGSILRRLANSAFKHEIRA